MAKSKPPRVYLVAQAAAEVEKRSRKAGVKNPAISVVQLRKLCRDNGIGQAPPAGQRGRILTDDDIDAVVRVRLARPVGRPGPKEE